MWNQDDIPPHSALPIPPSSFRREILGGVTTFVTVAYIIAKLENEGALPLGAITVATILSAMVGTLLMGLYANRPLAVAPYMGENAFIGLTAGLVLYPSSNWPPAWATEDASKK